MNENKDVHEGKSQDDAFTRRHLNPRLRTDLMNDLVCTRLPHKEKHY